MDETQTRSSAPDDERSSTCLPENHDFLAPPQAPDELGRLGQYRVLKLIGAGGMGVVFLAEDSQLRRQVALKAMKRSAAANPQAGQRFLREAQATAALKHDNIVTIYQVGEESGVPFLAMELLEGESLEDRLLRVGKLDSAETVRIGRETAEGLSAAHQRGLIHRDIKPANLWLEFRHQHGEPEASATGGRVKILDFGLARAADDDAHLTQQGAIVGTPAYMSPEQATGERVDHRSDLFSLGSVLYRLCTGTHPFRGAGAVSTLLAVATEHPAAPHEIVPGIPRSLSDLVMGLLAKNPQDRPASARAVVAALEKIDLDGSSDTVGEPTEQMPALMPSRRSVSPRTWVAAAALLLIVAAVIYFTRKEKDDGQQTPKPPETALNTMDALDPAQIPAAERFDWQPKELVAVIGEHRQRHWGGGMTLAMRPDGKQAASSGADLRIRIWDTATWKEIDGLQIDAYADSMAYSPDGKLLAIGGGPSKVQLWDVSGAKPKMHMAVTEDHAAGYVHNLTFAPDGKTLAYNCYAALDKDGVWLLDLSQKQPRLRARYPKGSTAAFSPDNKTLAFIHEDRSIGLYDLAEMEPKQRAVLPSKEGKAQEFTNWRELQFAPDGRLATIGIGPDQNLRLWDVSGPEPKLSATIRIRTGQQLVAFAANGKRMVTAQNDLQLWKQDGLDYVPMAGVSAQGVGLGGQLSPDGNTLVTGEQNGTVRFWEVGEDSLVEKNPLKPLAVIGGSPTFPTVLPHGPTLAFPTEDGQVRVWRFGGAAPIEAKFLAASPPKGRALAGNRDGKILVTGDEHNPIQLWHTEGTTMREAEILKGFILTAGAGTFSPDGKTLAMALNEKISLWDLRGAASKETIAVIGGKGHVQSLTLSPNGRTLFSDADNTVRLWNVADGKLTEQTRIDYSGGMTSLTLAPDGKMLAIGSSVGVDYWDLSEGKPRKGPSSIPGYYFAVAFSPDGKTLVAAGQTPLTIWEVATGRKLWEWTTAPGPVRWAAYAPDGRHIFTANSNGTIYVLRLAPPPEKAPR